MSRMTVRGGVAAIALSALLGACAGTNPASPSDAPTAFSQGSVSGGGGGGGGGGGTVTPAFYSGVWVQSPATHTYVPGQGVSGTDTLFIDLTTVLFLTQNGSKIDGEARRYSTATSSTGEVFYTNLDLGSPGKVTGTVISNGLSIAIKGLGEARSFVGYTLLLSLDSTTLTNQSTTPGAPATFVR